MTTDRYIKLGRLTALVSFVLGTVLFGLYFKSSSVNLLFIGYFFILLVGIFNLIILYLLLRKAKNDKDNKKKLLTTSGLMLLNIPVMLLYCWFAIILLNTMRITFTNSTKTILTNINISGCGGGHIDKLEIGESKTIWIDINADCSINIYYLSNGQQKLENVAGYVTTNMGQKMKYNIGIQNEIVF